MHTSVVGVGARITSYDGVAMQQTPNTARALSQDSPGRRSAAKQAGIGVWALLISAAIHVLLLGGLVALTIRERPQPTPDSSTMYVIEKPLEQRERLLKRRVRPQDRPVTIDGAARPIIPTAPPQREERPPVAEVPSPPMSDLRLTPVLYQQPDLMILAAHDLRPRDPNGWQSMSVGTGRDAVGRVGSGQRDGRGDAHGLSISVPLGTSQGLEANATPQPPPLANPLEMIARSLVESGSPGRPRDIVFVLDVSKSMQDNIYAVAQHLNRMADLLDAHGTDFRIGMSLFHEPPWYAVAGSPVRIVKLSSNVERVKRELRRVECSGGEKALNAIMETLERTKFRDKTERSLVFVTDEYVDGDFEPRQIFGALYRSGVRVDVIGLDEAFQRSLAARTGGVWIPISSLGG